MRGRLFLLALIGLLTASCNFKEAREQTLAGKAAVTALDSLLLCEPIEIGQDGLVEMQSCRSSKPTPLHKLGLHPKAAYFVPLFPDQSSVEVTLADNIPFQLKLREIGSSEGKPIDVLLVGEIPKQDFEQIMSLRLAIRGKDPAMNLRTTLIPFANRFIVHQLHFRRARN